MITTLFLISQLSNAPKILFVGNSHTIYNNVPDSVRQLLASDSQHRSATVKVVPVTLLENGGPDVEGVIRSNNWDFVVLQGALVSSSHKNRYRQDHAIGYANLALSRKARVLLVAEWPRRGWDESQYQLGVYREIQSAAKGSVIVPVCRAWDEARQKLGGIDLWAPDGNHANAQGSFLSACTIYRFITNNSTSNPTWRPNGLLPKEVDVFHSAAINALKLQTSDK